MSGLVASVLLLLAAAVVAAPRRWALLAIAMGVLYLTRGETLNVLGVNVHPMRVLELAAFLRVVLRREMTLSRITRMDKVVVAAYAYATLVFLARSALGSGTSTGIAQVSSMDKVGLLADAVLCYFAFRGLIRDVPDIGWFLRRLLVLLGPFVALLLIERLTKQNPFAFVGGLPTWVESGRIRCMASFRHPSLMGTLGASLLPLYMGMTLTRKYRLFACVGIGLCLAIVVLSNSGGPATMVAVVALAWFLWPLRAKMRLVRAVMIAAFVLLALVMKAPIWYLPDRVSAIVGGDGWHRSYLMDQAFRHIGDWWLIGMPLDQTTGWFPYLVLGAVDITNSYLAFGLDGGLLAMLLFVLVFVVAFRGIGRALAGLRRSATLSSGSEIMLWSLGASLAAHATNFLAITYFDQIYVVWFMQLAAISSVALACAGANRAPARKYRLRRDRETAVLSTKPL